MISKIRYYARDCCLELYYSLIHSHLNYNIVNWSCTKPTLDLILSVSPLCHNGKLIVNHDYFIPKRCCQLNCWRIHPPPFQMEGIPV